MAANMAQMGGGQGQMMPQHQGMPQGANPQLTAYLVNHVKNTPIPPNGITWQSTLMHQERVNKLLQLVTQLNMAGGGNMQGTARIVEQSLSFERSLYNGSQSKEHYMSQFDTKLAELLARRQANAPNLQNHLNDQAAAQAQQQQAQAMMNMHPQQMGRGMSQQGLQQMQRQMQMPNMPPQQQQQFRPQQQPQFQQQQQQQQLHAQQQQQLHAQQMAMNAGNQAGRGVAQNQPMMNQVLRQPQGLNMSALAEIQKLGNTDKHKVSQVAANLFKNATEEQKAHARNQIRQILNPAQLQDLQAQGRDPATYFFQQQAFFHLKANAARSQQQQQQQQHQPPVQQQGFPGPGGQQQPTPNPQAAMMQQQRSQQNPQQLQQQQQRQNLAGMGSQDTNDFSQFPNNLQSIHNQQLNGLMAENAGQMVVPASGRPNTATSQPMAQSMSSQNQNQNPNRTPRQPPTQPTPQGHANANTHQMNTVQQSQAQLQAQQLKQMQGQQNMMQGTQQSPPMGTLNTPVARPANISAQPSTSPFGDQRFNAPGFQGTNQQMVNMFLANIPAHERPRVQAMPQQEMQTLMSRWFATRQAQGQQMANRAPGMAQNNVNMVGPPPQQQQQQNPTAQSMGQGVGNNPMARTPGTNNMHPQAQQMMDNMDMPQNVISHMPGLPPEVKKWKDLKVWLQRNNQLPPNVRENLGSWQHKQFSALMQKQREMRAQQQAQAQVQAPQQLQQPAAQIQPQPGLQQRQQQQMQQAAQNPSAGMPGFGGPLQQQNPQMQVPPQIQQVTDQEIRQVRESRPQAANATDQQLRSFILRVKFDNWQKQHQLQLQAQAVARQKMGQMGGFAQPSGRTTPGGQVQTANQNQAPSQVNAQQQQQQGMQRANVPGSQGPPTMGQQQPQVQEQKPPPANNRSKKQQNQATQSPAQGGKNLKRSMADMGGDVDVANVAGPQQRKSSQSQGPKGQNAAMPTSEDPAQAAQGQARPGPSQAQQAQTASFLRLKSIGAEEQRNDKQSTAEPVHMSPEEYEQTLHKLRRISFDMNKIGQGLAKWYGLADPNDRDRLARLFFRSRNRIVKQFVDGSAATQPRPVFSITQADVDQFRSTLETMAKDITKHVQQKAKTQQGQQPGYQAQDGVNAQRLLMAQKAQEAQQTAQASQPPAEQQAPPVPLNAANLEKNAQALKSQKAASKNNKPPTAPTTAQPPFSLHHASSPHGNPSYIGKPKDINLQLPPARKKAKIDKVAGQGAQGATPSPKTTMRTPPVPQPAMPQQPPRPVLTCKDAECQGSLATFDSEQTLQQHIEDEHLKPRQDPLKFFSENLALALGLDPTGVSKKDAKQPSAMATMSRTASKQAATPAYLGTPKSMDGSAMKRSASSQSKVDTKPLGPAARSAPASPETWTKACYDNQGVLARLGIPEGISSVFKNMAYMRYMVTPKETPDSMKGGSEPNSDALDVKVDYDGPDVKWFSFDEVDANNLLRGEDNFSAALSAEVGAGEAGLSLDPTLLNNAPPMDVVDWDNDFSKPFQWDTSQYSFPDFAGAAT